MSNSHPIPRRWTRRSESEENTHFLVSMDKSLLSPSMINEEFAKDYIYWAKSMPEAELRQALDASQCFGLYECIEHQKSTDSEHQSRAQTSPAVKQIGFARLVTDNVTFFYLSDVFVIPEYQGAGLGTFMVQCIGEVVDSMQYLRRLLIMTGDKKMIGYYERLMDVKVLGEFGAAYILGRKGPGSCV